MSPSLKSIAAKYMSPISDIDESHRSVTKEEWIRSITLEQYAEADAIATRKFMEWQIKHDTLGWTTWR